jgi:CBS domain-containing protein
MKIHEVMSAEPRTVGLDNTLVEAAGVMRLFGIGAAPVCDDDRIVGMITEHDIVVRAVADGRDLNVMKVRDALSDDIVCMFDDEDVEEAATAMIENHVGCLPVLDNEQHLVGMVSRGDLRMMPAFD